MNRLKELREERGYTIRSLSAVIDIHYNTISSYENELRDFNTKALKKFAAFFEVTIDYLLCYSGYYIFVNYNNIMLKVNEEDYKLLYKEGFIYFDNNEKYHGIIDLMLVYDNYIDIIDYKLNDISDDAYLEQLKGYKKYIEKKFNKKTNIYLYSILQNKISKL